MTSMVKLSHSIGSDTQQGPKHGHISWSRHKTVPQPTKYQLCAGLVCSKPISHYYETILDQNNLFNISKFMTVRGQALPQH